MSADSLIPEDTSSLQVPDAGVLVEHVLELVATEAEALLGGDGGDGKLAELNVRSALASWDALHQPDEALRLLDLAEGHPLAARLRLAAALSTGDEASLAAVEPALGTEPALQLELAEAWLWRHGRADRAGTALERVLGAPQAAPALFAAARELGALAHAGDGWRRVLELRRAELRDDTDPEEVAALAALALDRGGDAAGALAMCGRALARSPGLGGAPAGGGGADGAAGRGSRPGLAGDGERAGPPRAEAGAAGRGGPASAGAHEAPTRAFGRPAGEGGHEAPARTFGPPGEELVPTRVFGTPASQGRHEAPTRAFGTPPGAAGGATIAEVEIDREEQTIIAGPPTGASGFAGGAGTAGDAASTGADLRGGESPGAAAGAGARPRSATGAPGSASGAASLRGVPGIPGIPGLPAGARRASTGPGAAAAGAAGPQGTEPGIPVVPPPSTEPGIPVVPSPSAEPGIPVVPPPSAEPGIPVVPSPAPEPGPAATAAPGSGPVVRPPALETAASARATPGSEPGATPGSEPGAPFGTEPGTAPGSEPGTALGIEPGAPLGFEPGAALGTEPGAPPPAVMERALGWLRVLDVAIDAAAALGDPRRGALLSQRAALVGALPGGGVEAVATRHAVASELERAGRGGAAAALWMQLADDPAAHAAGRRAALLRAAWAPADRRDPALRAIALAAHRQLADSECGEVAATHAWRALELAAAAGDPAVGDLARAVVDAAGGPVAERWLDELELAAPGPAALARYAARGGVAVRWAAAIAERGGERDRAIELWTRAAAEPGAPPTTRDHLVRLHRDATDDGEALAEAYAAWAGTEPDPRCAAALWSARGIVDLNRGDFLEAEESLLRASRLAPGDPFCRAALAEVYRAGKRYEHLATVLAELSTSLTSREARGAATREYAELLDEHLGDPGTARLAIERMLADRPGDTEAMLVLAKLCERDGDPDRAIELRRKAAELAPARAAEIWIEIAQGEERRGDLPAALAAAERAAEGRSPEALAELVRLHRAAGHPERALELAREELAAEPPLGRRMQLQTQIAQLLTELGREPQAVVTAYLEVLSLEPDQTEALAGIEAPARALGLWDELARAFRGAPQTPRNLEVLAEALEHIAEWSELAEVRRRQLEAAASPAERARRADDLAGLYARELGDIDGAVRMLLLAQAAQHDDGRQRELLRLLRAAQRWAEVAAVLERALPAAHPGDVDRQVEVLLELADLRANRLHREAEAIHAYEAVIERRPLEPTATQALEALYERLGRDRDLARLLEQRAEAQAEPAPRAQLFARVAALRHGRGDVDGAIAAFTAAFAAEPANRDVFTAMERVCYKAERWAAAMQLYDSAIAYVEAGNTRAYRLGDLYARRANVQLSFLGQPEAALASYKKVVEVDSQPQAASTALEGLCKRRGDFEPLIEAWERRAETQRDPQRKADALRTAAKLAAEHGGAGPRALRLNQRLLQLDPGDPGAAAALERYYEEAQDKSGLVEMLKVRLKNARNPGESVELLKRIARASEEGARDVVTATEHYQKILELQPENRDALDALGRIYESTEQWAEFIDVTRKQIKVTSDRNIKALLYFRCGSVMEAKFSREQDAIRYYDAAIKTSSACLPAVHGLRDLYRRREEWPLVIETLELEVKLWEDDKERAGVFAQIGRIYEAQLADVERAMHYYESALTIDPECLPANHALFDIFFEQCAWDKALPIGALLAQRAMRDGDPVTRSDFYRKRGVVSRMTGDPRAAAESMIVALEIRPSNAEALDALGTLAREQPEAWDFHGTYRELEKLYRRRDDAGPLLARVYVGRAAILEREGDLDQAAELYRQALELAPADLVVLSALVGFHADMRHWGEAVAAIERFVRGGDAPEADRIAALMRQVEIHADCEMEPLRAVAVLHRVLELDPKHQDAHYTLAQQHYLVGRYADAHAAIDRVIELATSPGQELSAAALARYYYYKGRILDAAGEARAAAPQYRRAIDYDPGYAPPALVLARRAADGGDQRHAEALLIEAAHAAMAQGGPPAAVPLQRGLARILLASGDRAAAIEAYRGILNVDPDGASDRVALAEIYAVDDPARAIGELRKVLDRDIHHAPAYRLLASYCSRTGDTERAARVLIALDLLGFAEDADRAALQRLRAARAGTAPLRRALDDAHRERYLLTPAARAPLGEVFTALAEDISRLAPQPSTGANPAPAVPAEARLCQLAAEIAGLFGVEPELYVADRVPGLAAVSAFPPRLVIDRALLEESDAALRFLLGYAFEAIRGGYAILLQVGARWRRELVLLLRNLLGPGAEQTGPAADLLADVTPEVRALLARHAGQRALDPGGWIDGMLALAKRAGLLACDDFTAAIWMVGRLTGEQLASHDATVALGSVLGGPDLVRFYLSDDYQHLRDVLAV